MLWQWIQNAFHDLRRFADQRDVATLVVIFPEAYQVTRAEPNLTPQHHLLDACRQASLRCLDLQPAFAAGGGDVFADVQHPNARGFAVAGAATAAALAANGAPTASPGAGEAPLPR